MNIGSFGFQGGGGSGGAPTTLNFGLWTQLNDSVPVVNTLIETTILGNGVGSLLVPENTFQIGDTFGLTMCGNINAQNNAKLTIKLHANGIDIGSTGLLTLNQATTKTWELKAIFTIRALGFAGVGVLATNGNFNYNADASSSFEGVNFSNIDSTNFDTTIPNILDVVAQWGTASLLDSISTTQVVLTKLF